ncbi:MAG: S-methyl-5'-thioinosine phosphorylase [Agarilytica sp.]
MKKVGIIGGSGFYDIPELSQVSTAPFETRYGRVDALTQGVYEGVEVVFLPRHGSKHKIPPHKVNYRANIDAMSQLGVESILAFNATGGIHPEFAPETLVVPDQVIDYTYGREHTFFDGEGSVDESLTHVDFTTPFDETLRQRLKEVLGDKRANCYFSGTYACTQGPRLESAAEIKKLQKDGGDLVGMTVMPEAALAKERTIRYASLCLIVNWCAGLCDEVITLNKILARLDSSIAEIREVILKTHTLG